MNKLLGLLLLLSLTVPLQPVFAHDADVILLNNEGVTALKNNETEKAIGKFKQALQKDASYKLARENLSIAYNNLGIANAADNKKALSAFHFASWLSPENKTCSENLLNSIKAAGKDANSFEDRKALGEEAARNNDFAGAILEFEAALKIKDDLDVKQALAAITVPEEYRTKPSVEASADVDFGPYMADLQRRIKRQWFPPRGKETLRVRTIFKIDSDGAISKLQIDEGSGSKQADDAALEAVQNAAPFRPLPAGAPQVVDIQFTFDYNVFSSGDPEKYIIARLKRAEKSKADSELAEILLEYGLFCKEKNRAEDAKKYYKRAKEIYASGKAVDKDREAKVNSGLGDVYFDEGAYKDAQTCYQISYDIRMENKRTPPAQIAESCHELGMSYLYLENGPEEKYTRARVLFNHAIPLIDDGKHAKLLIDLKDGLAHSYWAEGNYKKALPLYQWVLNESNKLTGAEKPDQAQMMQRQKDLADCMYKLEMWSEALPVYKQAVSAGEASENPNEDELNEAKARVDELCAKLNVPTDAEIAHENETKKSVNKAYAWLPYALGGSLLALLVMYLFGQKNNSTVDLAGKSDKNKSA